MPTSRPPIAEPPAQLVALCIDAIDPLAQATFWATVLRWDIGEQSATSVELAPTDSTGFSIAFVPVSQPKSGQNRVHLDLTTTSLADQSETVATVIALGGRHIDIGQDPEDDHVVMADPEGNELCIIGPENRFLAGCPRVGAVNCDGTQAVGYFWSAALGWPLVWDQDEETAIQAPDGTGPKITWSGPPLMPKHGKNRLHLDLAPPPGPTLQAEVERLVGLGATHADIGQGDVEWVVLADPDGNEFCVLPPR